MESLAPYVRQYVKILERPDVDAVSGIPPTVAIEQRISHAGSRSTVATLTEIYHFLRLLFAKLGTRHCPKCGRTLVVRSAEEMVGQIKERSSDRSAMLLAPKTAGRKGFHKTLLDRAFRKGFSEARIDGAFTRISKGMSLHRYQDHTIDLVVGRVPNKDVEQLISLALEEGNGTLILRDDDGNEEIYSQKGQCPTCGLGFQETDPRFFSFNSPQGACPTCEGLGHIGATGDRRICPQCEGTRLRPEALRIKVAGYSIGDLVQHSAGKAQEILGGMRFPPEEVLIAEPILAELRTRLSLLDRLGLSYLSLSRGGDTLSGGEAQRIRLAAQLGSNLTGACYILDEPTIGLHPKDNGRLIQALQELKGRGNSILVAEHDEETIRASDYIIDLGPGAGEEGER